MVFQAKYTPHKFLSPSLLQQFVHDIAPFPSLAAEDLPAEGSVDVPVVKLRATAEEFLPASARADLNVSVVKSRILKGFKEEFGV